MEEGPLLGSQKLENRVLRAMTFSYQSLYECSEIDMRLSKIEFLSLNDGFLRRKDYE